ncbi:BioY family transporter [Philodulcilactobacillus myokoensis]|uniref:Biotin transporter n=1 Tax=Philodulcilactobacillus myokoensis TaxID=2929573 RepID=A0A9W6ETC9_9LACO|nr:biotin transporter BioY [Philodulcilactobacillus myokoensis]GLB47585.1 BioY family transporter [Philodulcilactobacillus myokoensis]
MKVKEISFVGIFAALLILFSLITIPTPLVPFTLQTLAVLIIGGTLRPKLAISTVALYLLLGFVGLPVFAGGASSGPASFLLPTGGFLISFLLEVSFLSIMTSKFVKYDHYSFVYPLLASVINLVFGWIWFKFDTGMTWKVSLFTSLVPFIIPEIVKCVISTFVSQKLRVIIHNK